jgi:ATP-dependent RNA helicase RhlE
VLGLAETGTGKTAAFVLPILDLLVEEPSPGPRALIIAPTRELAAQIDAELVQLARFIKVRSLQVFGGVSEQRQLDGLKRSPDVIVACPGRLLDLHTRGALRLDRIEVLVLDEADHLFDMGFLPDVRRILAALPRKRQNLMFSATMPPEIRQLAQEVLQDPVVVELSRSAPAGTIDQTLIAANGNKLELLLHLLQHDGIEKAIIFTRTKHRARTLAKQLERSSHRAVALQGNMSQNARDRAMNGFRQGTFNLLIATDIASRGIDVPRISHVINYDMPTTVEAYTHRVGRTGRAELAGQAMTFVEEEDLAMVRAIERQHQVVLPRRTVEGFGSFPNYSAPSPASRQRSNRRPHSPRPSARGR